MKITKGNTSVEASGWLVLLVAVAAVDVVSMVGHTVINVVKTVKGK